MEIMDRCKRLLPLIMVLLTIPVVSNDNNRSSMPYREALSEEVKFWKQVFARISTNQHVIHDSQHLSVIYKIVSYDSNTSPRFRQRRIRAIKDEIEDLLLKFHRGQFEESRLTSWEREIYDQFKSIRESNKFLKASRRIRSQQGIREKFIKGLQRSFAYLPYIEKIFEEKGLPKELVYLPHVESSFNLYARSKVGAAGMWQFMRSTARSLMKVNWIIDQRIDPIVATKGAARILDYNYYVLRDWALAITAYNHGLNSMKRAKRRFGADYLKIRERYLRRSFGFASKNFYPEFLAVVEIMDSVDYFFPNVEKDSLLVFREIKLPTAISLPYFARKYGLDIDQLKKLNPAYRWKTWSGARRVPAGYSLRIPLNANAERILLSSGASIEDLREIEVARKDPVHGVLVLETIKERLARREAVQQALATTRPGIETGQLLMEDVAYLDEAHFALFEEQAEGSIVFEDAPTPNLSPQEMALAVLPKQSLELA
ncbi:MAG: transglycosylase SLT domain-containing protein, partial [Aliifodinibius sp.]|nr:transglycosylase SLT domain-containing protein [Fodinibius sp.]